MSRPRAEKLEAMRLFAEHHLEDIRYSRKGRDVVAVKHSVFGWISPRMYYALQHVDELLPKFVEGGYRAKAALWSTEVDVEVLGTGVHLPMSAGIIAGAIALYELHLSKGEQLLAALDLLALVIPFGEIYLVWQGVVQLAGVVDAVHQGQQGAATSQAIRIGEIFDGFARFIRGLHFPHF